MLTITPISAFTDNYIWCIEDRENSKALIVDPGQADPVSEYLRQEGLELDTILVTHHHPDHTGGIAELRQRHSPERVTGPADSPFDGITNPVHPGDTVVWGGLEFSVIAVPGHTLDHIAFYTPNRVNGAPVLFCGDTLFACGCGKVFEGTAPQMRESLASLRELPDSTRVFCGHEYTLANLKFARSWLPDDSGLADYEAECKEMRDRGEPTLPSTMEREKKLNPFLRWDDPDVIQAAKAYGEQKGLKVSSDDEVFAAVRHGKDNF